MVLGVHHSPLFKWHLDWCRRVRVHGRRIVGWPLDIEVSCEISRELSLTNKQSRTNSGDSTRTRVAPRAAMKNPHVPMIESCCGECRPPLNKPIHAGRVGAPQGRSRLLFWSPAIQLTRVCPTIYRGHSSLRDSHEYEFYCIVKHRVRL